MAAQFVYVNRAQFPLTLIALFANMQIKPHGETGEAFLLSEEDCVDAVFVVLPCRRHAAGIVSVRP